MKKYQPFKNCGNGVKQDSQFWRIGWSGNRALENALDIPIRAINAMCKSLPATAVQ
jgi:hypothetical protein